MLWPVLSVMVPFAAALDIVFDARGKRAAVYVLKPLTTLLILLVALVAPAGDAPLYQVLIVCGLVASLAGDVFLMLPGNQLPQGLASFLVAHLLYTAAFAQRPVQLSLPAASMLAAFGVSLVLNLWPHLGRMRRPVILYAAALLVMAWMAFGVWIANRDVSSATLSVGALLFVVSDSALASDRFVKRHSWGQPLVLSTYFAAQWLIATSLHLL